MADAYIICDDHAWVRSELTMSTRQMVVQNNRRKMVTVPVPNWTKSLWSDGSDCLITYPGFWAIVKELAASRGYEIAIEDLRRKLPPPNLRLALRKMRPPQRAWLAAALVCDSSGLLGAPTRFGKSYAISGYCEAYEGLRVVVVAPGVDLCEQLYNHIKEVLPHRRVHGMWTGSKHRTQSDDITVCSIDSLDKIDDADILLLDEPHACVADGRLTKINRFENARRIGFGATLVGRSDKKDQLIIGLIGPVLSRVTYLEAVASGAISPLVVVIRRVKFSKDTVPGNFLQRDHVYDRLLRKSTGMAKIIKKISDEVVPPDWQMMTFISNEKQADFLMDKSMPAGAAVAMAKKLKKKERSEITARIAKCEVYRIVASKIYIQGVTFPDLRLVVNAEGGGANTGAIQKPGRLLQVRDLKNYGVFVDFLFTCVDECQDARKTKPYHGIIAECWARIKAYKEIGYQVVFVDTDEEIIPIIKGSYRDE